MPNALPELFMYCLSKGIEARQRISFGDNEMNSKKLSCTLGAIMGVLLAPHAPADEVDYVAVEAKLRSLAPNATTITFSETPIAGLLQISPR